MSAPKTRTISASAEDIDVLANDLAAALDETWQMAVVADDVRPAAALLAARGWRLHLVVATMSDVSRKAEQEAKR